MTLAIVLDTGVLGMLTHPRADRHWECKRWLVERLRDGATAAVPEIADYELRRNLLLEGLNGALQRLDALTSKAFYLPLTTPAMRLAARLWADLRRSGRPTASGDALDGDVILAAQSLVLASRERNVVIATTNVGHLSRLAPAKLWNEINGA